MTEKKIIKNDVCVTALHSTAVITLEFALIVYRWEWDMLVAAGSTNITVRGSSCNAQDNYKHDHYS